MPKKKIIIIKEEEELGDIQMFLVKAFAYTNPGYYKWEIKKYGIKQPMKELKRHV